MAKVIVVKHTLEEGLERNTTIIATAGMVLAVGADVLVMADDLASNNLPNGREVGMICPNSTVEDAMDVLEKLAATM